MLFLTMLPLQLLVQNLLMTCPRLLFQLTVLRKD